MILRYGTYGNQEIHATVSSVEEGSKIMERDRAAWGELLESDESDLRAGAYHRDEETGALTFECYR